MLQRLRISLFFLLALSVLSATARAGSHYFFCSMTGRTVTDACCVAHRDHDSTTPAIEETTRACCESHVVGNLPASILKNAARIAPPALAWTRSVFVDEPRSHFSNAHPTELRIRPPNIPDTRSRTMVFLI